MDHETSTLREHNRKKNLFFKKMKRKKKHLVFVHEHKPKAIQHLQDEFQIENINKCGPC